MNLKTKEFVSESGLLITQLTVSSQGYSELHKHPKTHEYYQVLSGTGKILLEEKGEMVERTLLTGNFVSIPPDCPHKIRHVGQEIFPLVLLSIKNSNEPDYVNLE
jgi:oxalate decarboxylase/phosphoglucose isomerase-like protein (cupin superfamily)